MNADRTNAGNVSNHEGSSKPQPAGLLCIAGSYADDPCLAEICKEAYAQRDRERDQLLSEMDVTTESPRPST